jgi:hypothetical protein
VPKKERQPGFLYMPCEELQQEIALSEKSGWVFCEDGTKYSPLELKIIDNGGTGKITRGVHNVKKIFKGEIVRHEHGSSNQGKQNQGKQKNGTLDSTYTGGKIPETTGSNPAIRPGELEIY